MDKIATNRKRKGIVYLVDIAIAAVVVTTILSLYRVDPGTVTEPQEITSLRSECTSVLETAWNTRALYNPTNQSMDEWLNNTLGEGYRYRMLVKRYTGSPPRLERVVASGVYPPDDATVASCHLSRVGYRNGDPYYYEAWGWTWH